jgi:protein-S-isoprenylcysteine O-methyltransferase Ste14
MRSLELKIPPPLVALLLALGMWALARATFTLDAGVALRAWVSGAFVLAAAVFDVSALLAFRRARTTINPLRPGNASSLVRGGVYRFTRNPMYVGLLLLLLGWAVWLAAPWALLGPLAFVPYITRFQIVPEERVLARLFGAEFAHYQARVRRWL